MHCRFGNVLRINETARFVTYFGNNSLNAVQVDEKKAYYV